jgi:hypothetical protein
MPVSVGFRASRPASWFVTADTFAPRNPARFIPVDVDNYLKSYSMPEQSLALKKSDNVILRHSRGPQFRTKGGVFYAFLFLGLIIFAGYLFSLELVLLSVLSIISSTILFCHMLDIHGFEIDTATLNIRDYKKILWLKIGKWSNIKSYKSVYLTKERQVIHPSESDYIPDIYHYFLVKLVDEANKKEIILAEFKEYEKAQKLTNKVSNTLGIEAKFYRNKTEYV